MKTDLMFHYLMRKHSMNSTMLNNLAKTVPSVHVEAYMAGKKVRKNYRDQIDAAIYRYLILMCDTSEELRELLE